MTDISEKLNLKPAEVKLYVDSLEKQGKIELKKKGSSKLIRLYLNKSP